MTRSSRAPLIFFAVGIIGLGGLALVYGDFAEEWGSVEKWIPARPALVYASGIIMLFCGSSLLLGRTRTLSIRILFPFLIGGFLLKVPALVRTPLVEVNWESAGELALLLSGGWILFATLSGFREGSPFAFATGDRGVRIARIIFALALMPIGISHFVYLKYTADLVPAWLPFRPAWVCLSGAGHIAAGLGVLFSVLPRLAATLEAAMLAGFTVLVWVPKIVSGPATLGTWAEFFASWAIAACAWLVAESYAAMFVRT